MTDVPSADGTKETMWKTNNIHIKILRTSIVLTLYLAILNTNQEGIVEPISWLICVIGSSIGGVIALVFYYISLTRLQQQ